MSFYAFHNIVIGVIVVLESLKYDFYAEKMLMDTDDILEGSDTIREFLSNKLKLIKSDNERLSKVLSKRRELYQSKLDELNASSSHSTPAVLVDGIWKKIWNGKYAIGIDLICEKKLSANEVDLLLSWNSPCGLQYDIHCPTEFQSGNKKTIILTLDLPDFSTQLSYEITGFLLCKTISNTLALPSISLEPSDMQTCFLQHHLNKMIGGDMEHFLAHLYCNQKMELHVTIQGGLVQHNLDSLIEIDCGLTKLNYISGNQHYFLVHNISGEIDGCLLQFSQNSPDSSVWELTLYSRDERSHVSCILYLHRYMKGLIVWPNNLKDFSPDRPLQTYVDQLADTMGKELEVLRSYQPSLGDPREFRMILAEKEKDTDSALQMVTLAEKIQPEIYPYSQLFN